MRRSIPLAAALALLGCFAARRDWAQNNEVNIQFHAFQDTRSVTVLTPAVDLSKDYTDRVTLRVNYALDAISAASDSCARCHRDGVNNRRQVVGFSVLQKFDVFKWTIGGAYSKENFYRATTGLTSISRDFANGNTTVAGGYSFSLNQPVLHPTVEQKNQYANDAYVSVTQTLTRTTIAQAGYEIGRIDGYQNNPYLRADVNGSMVLGNVPDLRIRHTLTARVRQALPHDTFIEADYRRYTDDWQVTSNGFSVGASHRFTPQVLANFTYRRYDQSGAFFFQPFYLGPVPEFYTADFRLEPFNSGLYTGRLVIAPKRALFGLPQGSGLLLQYERYRADNGFEAGIFSTGVRVPLGSR